MTGLYQVKRLGGWARLWVAVSVIWIAGCALVAVLDWPKRENYQTIPTDAMATTEADAIISTGGDWWKDSPVVGGTRTDIEAAIRKAEKTGDSADAAKLRAYLTTLPSDVPKPPPGYVLDKPKFEGPWTEYAAPEKQGARKDRAAGSGDQTTPIRVHGPDGVITNFPYGTSDAKINEAMASIYSSATNATARKDAVKGGGRTMLKYEIAAPDGRTYQILGPEGASKEQVRNEVLRQHPDAAQIPGPQYDDAAFESEISTRLWIFLLAAFIPPALLAAAMFAIGWIRRGFAG